MKRLNKKTMVSVLIIVSSLVAVHIIQAATAEPGTDEDPLVTKSYVDQKFESFSALEELDDRIEELSKNEKEQTEKLEDLSTKSEKQTEKIEELSTKNEQQIEQIEELSSKNDANTKRIEELTKALNDLYEKNAEYELKTEALETRLASIESYGKFIPLELTENQKLMTGESAEIILRGGKAKAIGGEGGGLSDITSGTGADVNTDQDVPLNHLLLVSRDDGRGIKIVSKKAWVLVKGPYTIEEQLVED
mgnify:CR=1 FL=1